MGIPSSAEVIVRFAKGNLYSDPIKKEENDAIIQKVYSLFELQEDQKKILIYFTDHSNWFLQGSLGQTFILELEDHRRDLEFRFPELYFDPAFKGIRYIIILSHAVFQDDPIFKIFTIAHEFQHIVQYSFHLRHFLMNRVFFFYFRLTIDDRQAFYMKQMGIPNEYDARRKAKIINSEMNSIELVDQYLNKKISESMNGEIVDYSFLKGINTEAEYDFVKESEILWADMKAEIVKIVVQIEGRKDRDDRGSELFRAFDLFRLKGS